MEMGRKLKSRLQLSLGMTAEVKCVIPLEESDKPQLQNLGIVLLWRPFPKAHTFTH